MMFMVEDLRIYQDSGTFLRTSRGDHWGVEFRGFSFVQIFGTNEYVSGDS